MLLKAAILSLSFVLLICNSQFTPPRADHNSQIGVDPPPKFRLGDEMLLANYIDNLKDKNVAVITNQTGILHDGTHIIDALTEKGIKVVKIFSPEHGIRGDENYSNIDEKTGIPIVSLFGDKKKPSKQDLSDIDILIYDIQDVGTRFYTYTSTLYYSIQSAIENNKTLLVCDRPLVINQNYVDGFMLESSFESFVGKIPTPVCYGMTCGELANYLNGKLYSSSANIEIVKMDFYPRSADFANLNIKWVKPSPSMFYPSTAVCYPATCFLEGTNFSEGRGTDKPFEYIGASWCDGEVLAKELNSLSLQGVKFYSTSFTPTQQVSNVQPKFFNQQCSGVLISVTDKNIFEPVKVGVVILVSLNKLFKDFKFNKDNYIDKLAGTDKLRKMILNGDGYDSIVNSWKDDLESFKKEREKYLLYF